MSAWHYYGGISHGCQIHNGVLGFVLSHLRGSGQIKTRNLENRPSGNKPAGIKSRFHRLKGFAFHGPGKSKKQTLKN
jgi:hypothetical protein